MAAVVTLCFQNDRIIVILSSVDGRANSFSHTVAGVCQEDLDLKSTQECFIRFSRRNTAIYCVLEYNLSGIQYKMGI